MLPSVGYMELMGLALLAIIVVGPKDLPKLMRKLGQYMAKIRALGNEFKSAFDEMDVDGEVAAIRREIEELKKTGKMGLDEVAEDLKHEMRALEGDLRVGVEKSSPRVDKPKQSSEPND